LGSGGERVFETTVNALEQGASLTVLLLENPDFDPRVRTGIADDEFIRGDAPMTKAEVRAIVLSKLALSPDGVCADIGAGTGSVSVEMALAAYNGRVYAIEKEADACALIGRNMRKFQVGNVEILEQEATRALEDLSNAPPPVGLDAVFIGGSGGGANLEKIINIVCAKHPGARIVLTAVTLKTAHTALELLPNAECVQIGVSRLQKGMLRANNPIFVISGGGGKA
jgi:precorrin-6Y C5,15-methyltransferase (decarboxylating)